MAPKSVCRRDSRRPDQALLTDPQTSGGLLVSCTSTAVEAVLAVFRRHGFEAACAIGEVGDGTPATLTIR